MCRPGTARPSVAMRNIVSMVNSEQSQENRKEVNTSTIKDHALSEDTKMDSLPLNKVITREGTTPTIHMEDSSNTFQDVSVEHEEEFSNPAAPITGILSHVEDKYIMDDQNVIGSGQYGTVRECIDRETGERFAIKTIDKSKIERTDILQREVALLREVHHPNIIKFVDVMEDHMNLHIVTEICHGGELFDKIIEKAQTQLGRFSEPSAANLIYSVLDAIDYLHSKDIVHRDLKPENFLFSTKNEESPIKIIDFGLSRKHKTTEKLMTKTVGTPYYMAPEVLNESYNRSCDIWSVGVITYILLCGYPPFYGDDDEQIFDRTKSGRFNFPSVDWDEISKDAKDFIKCILRKDPRRRMSVREALQHKWLRTHVSVHKNKRLTEVKTPMHSKLISIFQGRER